MGKEIEFSERVTRNEERIASIKENSSELKNDLKQEISKLKDELKSEIKNVDDKFTEFKNGLDKEKKHKENMLLIKLSIIAIISVAIIQIIIRLAFPS